MAPGAVVAESIELEHYFVSLKPTVMDVVHVPLRARF